MLGIISERDYTRKVFLRGKRSRETRVEEIMSRDVTITTSNEPVENCMRLMTEKRIRHLPVVDDGKLRRGSFYRRSGETHHLDPKRDDQSISKATSTAAIDSRIQAIAQ